MFLFCVGVLFLVLSGVCFRVGVCVLCSVCRCSVVLSSCLCRCLRLCPSLFVAVCLCWCSCSV